MAPIRLLLAAQPHDGGVARHLITLVRALPDGQFEVDVACPRGSLAWTSLEGTGVELHPIESHREPRPGDARSWATLVRLAGRADVIHVHSAKAGFLGRLAAATRGRRRACVFTPHGWSWWAAEGAEARLYLSLERLAARWCRTIVALSRAEREAGLDVRVGNREQYRVIPNGVPLERFALVRRPGARPDPDGRQAAAPKRPDLAIRALAAVREHVPGASCTSSETARCALRPRRSRPSSGSRGAVRFLGTREDVPMLLAEAECALLASDYEGCPLAVVEAMAASVAVAATEARGGRARPSWSDRSGGAARRSRGAGAGRPRRSAGPERPAAMGTVGRQVAEAELSLELMMGRLVALYEEAAG